MKYIRTKDEIIKITEKGCIKEFNGKQYAFRDKEYSYRYENGKEFIKLANTIEELCDCYSYDTETTRDVAVACSWKLHNKEREIFGCIKTDKGIIYVAKMNDNGELELL